MPLKTVIFTEGDEFIHCKTLGAGVTGAAVLVRSIADGKLYVRKEDHELRDPRRLAPPCGKEVANALRVEDVATTATCRGWSTYKNPEGRQFVVSYWDYYCAGTLVEAMEKFHEKRQIMPERWITGWLFCMVKTMGDIHKRGVYHLDAHMNNWFITGTHGGKSNIPKIGLGDFGHSAWTSVLDLKLGQQDYRKILSCVRPLLNGHRVVKVIQGGHVVEKLQPLEGPAISSNLRSLLDHMQTQIEKSKNGPDLEDRMKDVFDELIDHFGRTRKPTSAQDSIITDLTPDEHFYNFKESDMNKKPFNLMKAFNVCELTGPERRHVRDLGRLPHLAHNYKMTVDGGFDQKRRNPPLFKFI